jgi:hypothetical protein
MALPEKAEETRTAGQVMVTLIYTLYIWAIYVFADFFFADAAADGAGSCECVDGQTMLDCSNSNLTDVPDLSLCTSLQWLLVKAETLGILVVLGLEKGFCGFVNVF